MPITNLKGNLVYIPFYITYGDGFFLLYEEILQQSDQNGPSNEIRIPPGVLSDEEVDLSSYFEAT